MPFSGGTGSLHGGADRPSEGSAGRGHAVGCRARPGGPSIRCGPPAWSRQRRRRKFAAPLAERNPLALILRRGRRRRAVGAEPTLALGAAPGDLRRPRARPRRTDHAAAAARIVAAHVRVGQRAAPRVTRRPVTRPRHDTVRDGHEHASAQSLFRSRRLPQRRRPRPPTATPRASTHPCPDPVTSQRPLAVPAPARDIRSVSLRGVFKNALRRVFF